ncbi:MAG TPA: type II toxin-antitoxin system RelE/ParE family toxin [Candidatus Dormibacteraeota bacterium]|nr:type II toxin-antitoxin system RelE/ParE family toxin [Candidatus Dormibacteraeota bacterium]
MPRHWRESRPGRASSGRKPSEGCGPLAEPPRWRIVLDRDANKQLLRLSRPDRQRIERAIALLPAGDVRRLKGTIDLWRLRVGDWRIRFRLDGAERRIDVLAVNARGNAYKD